LPKGTDWQTPVDWPYDVIGGAPLIRLREVAVRLARMTTRRWMTLIAMIAPIAAVFACNRSHIFPSWYADAGSWLVTVLLVVSAALGGMVASWKDRSPTEGILLGIYLGPLGLLVERLLPERLRAVENANAGTDTKRER
jgi:hypothetical protein